MTLCSVYGRDRPSLVLLSIFFVLVLVWPVERHLRHRSKTSCELLRKIELTFELLQLVGTECHRRVRFLTLTFFI